MTSRECKKCGTPLEYGRPWTLDDNGDPEPSWYYQCDCSWDDLDADPEWVKGDWEEFDGDYRKGFFDVELHDGSILYHCYPNAGFFNWMNPTHDESTVKVDVSEVVRVREICSWTYLSYKRKETQNETT